MAGIRERKFTADVSSDETDEVDRIESLRRFNSPGDRSRFGVAMTAEKILKVKNRLGLHARPAALFVQTAGRFRCQVKVAKGDIEVNGKSMMGLMMLAAEQGSDLKVTMEGEDAAVALAELEKLFDRNFDE